MIDENLDYFHTCEQMALVPDFKTRELMKGELDCDLSHYGIGDSKTTALLSSINFADLEHLETLSLTHNRLSSAAALCVVKKLSSQVKELNFAHNRCFTGKKRKEFCEHLFHPKFTHLVSISLRNNAITDAQSVTLFKCMKGSFSTGRSIHSLDLQENEVGLQGGQALAVILEDEACQLRSLDLSFNAIRGKAMLQICLALASNMSIKYLNLSYNSLAQEKKQALYQSKKNASVKKAKSGSKPLTPVKGSPVQSNPLTESPPHALPAQTPAMLLSASLSCNQTIEHLNISHCQLTSSDCNIIGAGLRANTTLLGIHVDGNEGYVNSEGFVQGRDVCSHTGRKCSFCWICEDWNEILIEWRRSASTVAHDIPMSEPITSVTVHFEAHGFEAISMLCVADHHANDELDYQASSPTRRASADFAVATMHPVGEVKFYFVVNGMVESTVKNIPTRPFKNNLIATTQASENALSKEVPSVSQLLLRHSMSSLALQAPTSASPCRVSSSLVNVMHLRKQNLSSLISRPREPFSITVYERFLQRWDIDKSIFKKRKTEVVGHPGGGGAGLKFWGHPGWDWGPFGLRMWSLLQKM
jgi:hypothetical protein